MIDFKVGSKLPDDFLGAVPEGMSGVFSDRIILILKMEDLEKEDIESFNKNRIEIDLLEINTYEYKIGKLYALSVLVDGFIDNSEVMIDFRVEDIEEIMPTSFKNQNGIKTIFALVDEEDNILGLREFKIGTELSNIISDKAYKQNQFIFSKQDEDKSDYVLLAFQKLFENEPEENLRLFSIGKSVIY